MRMQNCGEEKSHEQNNIFTNRMDDDGTERSDMGMDLLLDRVCVRCADMDFGEDCGETTMKDDELYLIFCNPVTAIDFLGGDDAVVIENSIVMSPVIPEGEVTLVQKDEFLEWLKGKENKE